ncbi:hypothetical protein [Escherichia coli]|uniref:hypothetical protein n=1 Tax=Escherichia coli TaxID=562 RepID=UPI0015EFEBD3|nr:hypothetical protein [Escherichia coli]MDY8933486.1 hypothetical protein [Escherichia coli]WDN86779.1 hypothetical protein LOF66_24840 [Escherichia coli]
MGSCTAPSAKGDDKFITTDYLQQCPLRAWSSLVMSTLINVQWQSGLFDHLLRLPGDAANLLI